MEMLGWACLYIVAFLGLPFSYYEGYEKGSNKEKQKWHRRRRNFLNSIARIQSEEVWAEKAILQEMNEAYQRRETDDYAGSER